ncbi:MAG TPA: glycoside hydrolase family 11 protein [Polyangia bacterium]|jgi:hypothetical protein
MKLARTLLGSALLTACAAVVGCASGSGVGDPDGGFGTGGTTSDTGSGGRGTGGSTSAGSGGSTASGTGGNVAPGTGGSVAPGTGGSVASGTGGSVVGTGGTTVVGGRGGGRAGGTTGSGGVTTGGGGRGATGGGGRGAAGGSTTSGSGGRAAGGSTGAGGASAACAPATALTGGTQHSSSNASGTVGSYQWTIWSSGSGGSLTTYANAGAAFSANWNNSGDFLARVGLQWDRTKTYDQYGTISADFAETKTGTAGGYSYIGIYGWSVNPTHEYYIVEDSYNKLPLNPGGTKMGTVMLDGGTYDLYQRQASGASIDGSTSFVQFYSVRQSARQCGHISISEHFKAWTAAGMVLGKMEEAKVLVEAGGGSGSASFTTAAVTIVAP